MIRLDEYTSSAECAECQRATTHCPRCKSKRCGRHLVESAKLEERREMRVVSGTRRVQGNLIGVARNPALPPWVGGGETPIFEENHFPYTEDREFVFPVFVCLTADGETLEVEAPEDAVKSEGWASRRGECVRCRHDAMYEALSAVEADKAEREQKAAQLQRQLQREIEQLEAVQADDLAAFDREHELNLNNLSRPRPSVPGWNHILWVGPMTAVVVIPILSGIAKQVMDQSVDEIGVAVTGPIIGIAAIVAIGILLYVRYAAKQSGIRWDRRDAARKERTEMVAAHEREIAARRVRFSDQLKALSTTS